MMRGKKSVSCASIPVASLELALDRTHKEQVALVRSLVAAESALKGWCVAANSIALRLNTFQEKVRQHWDSCSSTLQSLASALEQVVQSWYAAEAPASSPPSASLGKHGGAASGRSQLDALSRGVMGLPVSTLVNTLRTHVEDLSLLEQKLSEMKQRLSQSIAKELNEMKSVSRDIQEISQAVQSQMTISG